MLRRGLAHVGQRRTMLCRIIDADPGHIGIEFGSDPAETSLGGELPSSGDRSRCQHANRETGVRRWLVATTGRKEQCDHHRDEIDDKALSAHDLDHFTAARGAQ